MAKMVEMLLASHVIPPQYSMLYAVEMCMGMVIPMGMGIPWEFHGNGDKTQKWKLEWERMGNQVSGNGNYLHSHGNAFPWEYITYSRKRTSVDVLHN